MATKTFEELKQLAIQIRDEKTNKQNTATRIGTQMLEHLDKLEQDYYDKTATDEELKERDEKLTELDNKLISYYNKLDFILSKSEDVQSGVYYSAGGVLSEYADYKAIKIDISKIETPRSFFCRAGINGSDFTYCYCKTTDGKYEGLNKYRADTEYSTGGAIFNFPPNVVELNISWDTSVCGKATVFPFIFKDIVNSLSEIKTKELLDKHNLVQKSFNVFPVNVEDVDIPASCFNANYGFVSYTDGNVQGFGIDKAWKHTDFIEVKEGQTIRMKVSGYSPLCAIACYDSDYVYDKNNSLECTEAKTYELVVPQGVSFVKLSSGASTFDANTIHFSSFILFKSVFDNEQDEKIKEIEELVKSFDNKYLKDRAVFIYETVNLNDLQWNYGYVSPTTGNIIGLNTDTNWKTSEELLVSSGSTYKALSPLNGQYSDVSVVSFYDAQHNYLSESSIKESLAEKREFIIPEQAVYMRLSGSSFSFSSCNIEGYFAYNNGTALDYLLEQSAAQTNNIETLSKDVSILSEKVDNISQKPLGYFYDVEHFIQYGQSLSQGDWLKTVVSTSQKYNSVMFTGTPRVWEYRDQEHRYDAFVPAIENVFEYQEDEQVVGANYRGETPACGTAENFINHVISEDGYEAENLPIQMLVSAPGMGGMNIENLGNKNGIYYQRLLEDVRNGKRLANAQGKSYACHGVSWIQGEANCAEKTSYEDYYKMMKDLFDNLNNDIKAITGQEEDVHFFLYQTWCFDWYYTSFTYPFVPLAQLQISLDMYNVHMVSPIYHLPLIGDYTHFTAEGSKWFGGYLGLAFKRVIIDGKNWEVMHPKKVTTQGNCVYIRFHLPVGKALIFDTTSVPDRGVSKGFQIREKDDYNQNSYLDIITNVEIIKNDMVKITCSESPVGKRLTYAINGTGKLDMSSGNLRDTSEEVFNFTIEKDVNKEHKMYNWCPHFQIDL